MHLQATRTTQKQLAYLAYWQDQKHGGYRFAKNELAPENTVTPPSFASRHPIIDAAIGGLILAAGFGGLLACWISIGSGIV